MASDQAYVDFAMDQLSALKGVSSRKMFGEYAIFVENKVVALMCRNTPYVKPKVRTCTGITSVRATTAVPL